MIEKDDYRGLTAEQWSAAYNDLHRRYRDLRDRLIKIKALIEEK